jgi:CheY-like chemotaxis protein
MSTAGLIEDLGHQVSEAASAEDALALMASTHFDFIITDLGLPGMSGEAFAVKAWQLRPGIGIVFATGRNQAPETADGGPSVLLEKPYDGLRLAAALAKLAAPRDNP